MLWVNFRITAFYHKFGRAGILRFAYRATKYSERRERNGDTTNSVKTAF